MRFFIYVLIILSSFITQSTYSEEKILDSKAIMICADKKFLSHDYSYLRTLETLYNSDKEINNLTRKIKKQTLIIEEFKDLNDLKLNEWLTENPLPVADGDIQNFENWLKAKEKVQAEIQTRLNDLQIPNYDLINLRDDLIIEKIKKEIFLLSPSEKAKKFERYFEEYIKCEEMLINLPESFKIKFL